MYIETLTSPHPAKAQNEQPIPFVEALETHNQADIIATAQYAGQLVAQSVVWHEDRRLGVTARKQVPFASLGDNGVTNCFGYTAAMSEALDHLDIPSYIGYANGHTFNLVPESDEPTSRLWFIDSLIPKLNQPLGPATMRRVGTVALTEQLANSGRGAFVLQTHALVQPSGKSLQQFACTSSPWVMNTSDPVRSTRDGATQSVSNLVATAYTSSRGRQVLASMAGFEDAITKQQDYASAHAALIAMAGDYPDLDIRHKHGHIRELIRELALRQDFSRVNTAINAYIRSFAPSSDARIGILEADLCRSVIFTAPEHAPSAFALRAEALYMKAEKQSRYGKNVPSGKLAKLKRFMAAHAAQPA